MPARKDRRRAVWRKTPAQRKKRERCSRLSNKPRSTDEGRVDVSPLCRWARQVTRWRRRGHAPDRSAVHPPPRPSQGLSPYVGLLGSTTMCGENEEAPGGPGAFGGRCRTRTDDLFRVKEARYQLRQSPASRTGLIDRTGCRGVLRTIGRAAEGDTRGARPVLRRRSDQVMSYECSGQAPGTKCGCSAVVAHHLAKVRVASSNLVIRSSEEVFVRESDGRSRHVGRTTHGGVAERLGTGLQSRLHGFESRRHLAHNRTACIGAIGAAVARFPDTEEVTGSIPVSRTAQYR